MSKTVPLVFVVWDDSRQASHWQHVEDFKPQGVCFCKSVGWLVYESPELVAIAGSLAFGKGSEPEQYGAVIEIPRKALHEVTVIEGYDQ